jgi:hypothetical protein
LFSAINILQRKSTERAAFKSIDRLVFAGLYRLVPGVLDALKLKPETAIRWQRRSRSEKPLELKNWHTSQRSRR